MIRFNMSALLGRLRKRLFGQTTVSPRDRPALAVTRLEDREVPAVYLIPTGGNAVDTVLVAGNQTGLSVAFDSSPTAITAGNVSFGNNSIALNTTTTDYGPNWLTSLRDVERTNGSTFVSVALTPYFSGAEAAATFVVTGNAPNGNEIESMAGLSTYVGNTNNGQAVFTRGGDGKLYFPQPSGPDYVLTPNLGASTIVVRAENSEDGSRLITRNYVNGQPASTFSAFTISGSAATGNAAIASQYNFQSPVGYTLYNVDYGYGAALGAVNVPGTSHYAMTLYNGNSGVPVQTVPGDLQASGVNLGYVEEIPTTGNMERNIYAIAKNSTGQALLAEIPISIISDQIPVGQFASWEVQSMAIAGDTVYFVIRSDPGQPNLFGHYLVSVPASTITSLSTTNINGSVYQWLPYGGLPTVPPTVPPPPSGGEVSTPYAVGGPNGVTVYDANGVPIQTLNPFGGSGGSPRVATGDFNGDGIMDLAIGQGPTRDVTPRDPSTVIVLAGPNYTQKLHESDPFGDFVGGVFLAAGDVNNDGRADLAITPDVSGGPRVRVWSGVGFVGGSSFTQINDFFGIEHPEFRGGARAAIGDINNDGFGDLAISAGFGGGPRIAVWDGKGLVQFTDPTRRKLRGDFFAYEDTLRNGAFVAIADLNGDGFSELITGAGPGGGPRVSAFDGRDMTETGSLDRFVDFFAGDPNARNGVTVARTKTNLGRNLPGDDLVTGALKIPTSTRSVYIGTTLIGNPFPQAVSSELVNTIDESRFIYVG